MDTFSQWRNDYSNNLIWNIFERNYREDSSLYFLFLKGGGREKEIYKMDREDKENEKKRKKGRVPGINKSVKFCIIKDFMDCDH